MTGNIFKNDWKSVSMLLVSNDFITIIITIIISIKIQLIIIILLYRIQGSSSLS